MLKIAQNNRVHGLLLIAMIVLASCSSAPKKPAWVDKPDSDYPAVSYMSAIGAADDRQVAADRAASNLGKIFEVAVQESTVDFSSAQIGSADGQQMSANEQKVTRSVSTEAKHVLEGARIVEYWKNEQGRVFALAVLAKQPAASRFRQAILAEDREVSELINYASTQADNPVSALSALRQARQVQVQRDQNNKSLTIVTDGQGIKGRYDTAAVDTMTRNALARLKVAAQSEDASMQAELQKALSKLGVQVAAGSNLVLSGSIDMAPVENKQGWFWLRGSYELVFADSGRVLARQRWPVKVSSTEQGLLQQRARDEMNQNLPQYVYELLATEPN